MKNELCLLSNQLGSKVRLDSMEEREYFVAPMVILVEGVHAGSNGPVYYPAEELAKTPSVWNHKPIVVYHPELNGRGVSACDPIILTNRKVGLMMNTVWDPKAKKLKAEAWIEKNRAEQVDPRVLQALETETVMELSTGLFVDLENEQGKWKDKEYSAIARNIRPDHLALLPDKKGACSVEDGAGFLRNIAVQQKVTTSLVGNEISYASRMSKLNELLSKRFESANTVEGSLYVADLFDDFVIYESGGKLFRLGYTVTETEVVLSDAAPEEVVRVTEYRTPGGAFIGNSQINPKNMDKKKIVDAILANGSVWSEEDRGKLEGLNEAQLEQIQQASCPPSVPSSPSADANSSSPAAVAPPVSVVQDGASSPLTVQDYVAQAPAPIRELLLNSLSIYEEEKSRMMNVILSAKANRFAKEELASKPLRELQAIAALCEAPAKLAPNYTGQAPAPVPANTTSVEVPLALPVIDFKVA